jgi:hypothetical protein
MLTEAFQSVIPTTNWMYPAALPAEALPEGFDTLITPDRALILSPEEAAAIREEAIETWQSRAQPLGPLAWTGAGLTALVLLAVLGPLLAVLLAAEAPARLGSADWARSGSRWCRPCCRRW